MSTFVSRNTETRCAYTKKVQTVRNEQFDEKAFLGTRNPPQHLKILIEQDSIGSEKSACMDEFDTDLSDSEDEIISQMDFSDMDQQLQPENIPLSPGKIEMKRLQRVRRPPSRFGFLVNSETNNIDDDMPSLLESLQSKNADI